MTSFRHWLAIAAVLAIAGCQESKTGESASTGTSTQSTSGSQAGTSTGSTATTGGSTSVTATSQAPAPGPEVTTPSGLKYRDLVVGTGAEAVTGKMVTVHYTGWLTDGTKVDSSVDRGEPIQFPLGTSAIIRGWNEGLTGMKVGGKRKLTVPPDLGYGSGGRPPRIPPNATLEFEVELVGVS